ncbi:MAG: YkgJ family cysteine cluster protein [Candidatus Thorarchaeota archaeon]
MINICENCGKCCIETEMLLSIQDIDLLVNNSVYQLDRDDFALKNAEGFYQLKNIEGHCYFFDVSSKNCNIYEYRPQGCRIYPLIYDFQTEKCTLDKDCPRANLFYKKKNDFKIFCKRLKIFLKKQLNLTIN